MIVEVMIRDALDDSRDVVWIIDAERDRRQQVRRDWAGVKKRRLAFRDIVVPASPRGVSRLLVRVSRIAERRPQD